MVKFCGSLLAFALLGGAASGQRGDTRERLERGAAHYREALAEYQNVKRESSDARQATLRYNMGVCYYQLGKFEEAVREYQAAIDFGGGRNSKVSYALGMALTELGDWHSARIAFATAWRLSGARDAEAAFDLGVTLARLDEYNAAAQAFRQAIKRKTRSLSAAHNNLGVMLMLSDQAKGSARREFETALRLAGGDAPEAEYNLNLWRSPARVTNDRRARWKMATALDAVNH